MVAVLADLAKHIEARLGAAVLQSRLVRDELTIVVPSSEIVAVRRIFFCSNNTPYRRASAVGGQPGT